jgi:hypothetical protein
LKRTLLLAPLFGVVLLIGLAGCQTTPAGSTAPPPIPPGGAALISETDAANGRTLYLNKCAGCHKFHDPAGYNDADWHKWMNKMSRKAHLNPDDRQILEQFLRAYRTLQ